MIDNSQLTLPRLQALESNEVYGRYALEPLERGYGLTLGNALRRVLLGSLPGRAITSVKIDGALSLDSELPGVKEDVTELLLNLKAVRFTSQEETDVVTLRLEASGPGEATADKITGTQDIEIATPEAHIATLEKGGRLAMELTTDLGRGYQPSDGREGLSLGEFPVDAIFTPVIKVNYSVEQTRLGQSLNYDRLILDVHTDPTITPDEALQQAAAILVDHFSLVAGVAGGSAIEVHPSASPDQPALPKEAVNLTIDDLDLSTRTYNALRRSNITKVSQLIRMTEEDLKSIRNFGSKSVEELRDKMAEKGLL